MKEETKQQAKPKFEDLLNQEEVDKKNAAKKIKVLQTQNKNTDQNDFKAAMSMATNIIEQQDHKKKLTKAVRSKKQGDVMDSVIPQAQPQQKDKFSSLYD